MIGWADGVSEDKQQNFKGRLKTFVLQKKLKGMLKTFVLQNPQLDERGCYRFDTINAQKNA
jgi:hypothetical protein